VSVEDRTRDALRELARAASLSRRVLMGDQLARELAEIVRRAHQAQVGFVAFGGRILADGPPDVEAHWDADGPSPVIRLALDGQNHAVPWPASLVSSRDELREVHRSQEVIASAIDVDGRVEGLLGAWLPLRRDSFDELDDATARVLSLQASTLAKNRDRERQSAWRTRGLEALQQITSDICATTEIDVVFEAIARSLKGVMQFCRASVVLLEEGSPGRVRAATFDGAGEVVDPGEVPISRSVLEVVRTGKVNITPDLRLDPDDDNRALLELGVRSAIVAPLVARGRVIGTLNVGSPRPDAFDDHHGTMVQAIADQVAQAVENAHAFTRRREAGSPT